MKQSIVKTIIFVGFLLTILGVIIDPLIAESPLATVRLLQTASVSAHAVAAQANAAPSASSFPACGALLQSASLIAVAPS